MAVTDFMKQMFYQHKPGTRRPVSDLSARLGWSVARWSAVTLLCLLPSMELAAQVKTASTPTRATKAVNPRTAAVRQVNQSTMPLPPGEFSHVPERRSVRDYSWIYIEQPELEEIKQHDIITILVDKKYQDTVNSNFNRTRNSSIVAELKEFIRISEDGNLTNAAENSPTVDAGLQGKITSQGLSSNREGIQYRIAAIVVEVLPNGNLVLEARDRIEINGDIFVYTLSGVLPSDKVAADMTATSDNVYNLSVEKGMKGKVGDSVKRPWGVWLYDKISPF